ncbi:hypothetical protein [Streptococcus sp. DD13]|uniref:hypothetical protein n=1 Tax=Streptococcus sp. DD13 TaxID=1777881 RepID=UPI00079BDAD0|nr:hypothetical protein [Streptococcus sp. DD13]KXT78419.1 hypothetical protein STRDD13_00722 [Streptococcus sp. DD13]
MKLRKKWLFISLFILMLGGIGMVILYQQRAQEETELIRHEQERMALYLVNYYEGVEEIEFTSFRQNSATGTWSANATVNGDIHITLSVINLNSEGEIGIGNHIKQSNNKKLIKKRIWGILQIYPR